MSDSQRFPSRAEVDELAQKLADLPTIEREFAIALTGQTRLPGPRGAITRRPQPDSRPPYPLHIADALDALKATLVAAVRDIEETRHLRYTGGDTITGCGTWLTRNRFALMLMDTGMAHWEHLCHEIDQCAHMLGEREAAYTVSQARVDAANRQRVTALEAERIARKLGDAGRGLTRQRVDKLRRRGLLAGARASNEDPWTYALGDVLRAHQEGQKKAAESRKKAAESH
ncbi:MAG: hypothetical protein QM662_02525 [Gordonia sp. (in: high G+C Gram-positive bacteria)]